MTGAGRRVADIVSAADPVPMLRHALAGGHPRMRRLRHIAQVDGMTPHR